MLDTTASGEFRAPGVSSSPSTSAPPTRAQHPAWLAIPTVGEVASWTAPTTNTTDAAAAPRIPDLEVTDGPKSWALPVSDGTLKEIGIWRGSAHWFDTVMDMVSSPAREALRDRHVVADNTLLQVADQYRSYANWATGHGVSVAHGTVARAIDKSEKTVQRATRLLEELGLMVTLRVGRSILTADEKAEAFQTHGNRQLRAANVAALTLPPVEKIPSRDENVHLTTPPTNHHTSRDHLEQQRRASAHMEAAPQLRQRQEQVFSTVARPPAPEARPLTTQRYLAELDRRFDGRLGLHHHIGNLERVLRRAGVDLQLWTVDDLATTIEKRFPTARERLHTAKEPLRYFAWMLSHTITPGETPPRVELDERARRRAAEREAFHLEQEQVRARLAADDPQEFERITAAMRREQAEARRRAAARLQVSDSAAITQSLLGAGRRPHEFDVDVRKLHDRVLAIHRYLTDRGWVLNRDEIDAGVEWTWQASRISEIPDDTYGTTTIYFTPPDDTSAAQILTLGLAGDSWQADEPLTDAALYERIRPIETHRAG